MRKSLQIALMASTVATTSFFLLPQLRATDGGDGPGEKITATDDHGRTIYTNDSVENAPVRRDQTSDTPRRKLMYWSSKENRWKPVPAPNTASMRAARSAAAEVNQSSRTGFQPIGRTQNCSRQRQRYAGLARGR